MKPHILASERFNISLELKRKIVGIKFLNDKKEFDASDVKPVRGKMPYCVMIRLVSQGHSFKVDLDHSGCKGATRALGMEKPSEKFHSGEEYNSFGLYENQDTAKLFADDMNFIEKEVYGIEARPIEEFVEEPDIAIIITNPYNAMRISQGYSYKFGHNSSYRISGNQAVCSECTATPYIKNDVNFSMMCAGTRYLAGWSEEEMGVGFSIDKFNKVAEGVFYSINGAENNEKKEIIEEKLKDFKDIKPKIEKDGAYFIDK